VNRSLASVIFTFLAFVLHAQEFIPASAIGGNQQIKYFIDQELIYPPSAYETGIEGKVAINYSVDEKGQIAYIIFRDKLTPDCDRETLRIFRMFEWEPATVNGIPVKDNGVFEVSFNIKKYNRLCKQRGYTLLLYPYEPQDTSLTIYQYRNLETAPHPIFTNEKINLAGFVAANLKYPDAAIKQNLSGVVTVGFIVEPHGRISNTYIVNSLGAGCNEEALRIVRMIKWMPGTQHRMAVRTRMSISISFSLEQGPDGNFNPNVKSSYGG
jgi:TonB family protein